MRELNSHKVNPANDKLTVAVLDEPGSGGACHVYEITGYLPPNDAFPGVTRLEFQNGPIAEAGVNGITHEALLAVLIDRLECFQKGRFANSYNQRALEHLVGAQESLKDRTRDRVARGVEGTHTV
jgi:hypothetical protein